MTATGIAAKDGLFARIVAFAERHPARALVAVLAAHVVVWTALPWALNGNLQLDLVDGLALGREWQFGYWKHPPLPWWIVEATSRVTGLREAVYILGPLMSALAMWGVWLLGRRVTSANTALVAALALEGAHYYNFSAVKFAHDQLQLPVWAFAILTFHAALTRARRRDWIAAGAMLGLAVWSKYAAAVLGLSFALFLVLDPAARRHWKTPGPYLMALATLAVAAPNLVWLVTHDFLPFRYVDARAVRAEGAVDYLLFPLQWAGAQLLTFAPVLLLVALAAAPFVRAARSAATDFHRRFLLMAAFGPALLVVAAFTAAGRLPVALWGYPLWNALPLALLLPFAPVTRAGLRRFAAGFALVALAYPLAYAGVEIFEPAFRDRPKATQFPGREAASRLTAEWRQRYGTPLAYVAGTEFASNNIAVYSPDRPHVVVHADPSISPWIDRADLARRGAILVWENAGPPPAGFLDRFPAAEIRPPLVLPRLTRFAVAPDIVGYAFVAPKP